MSNDFFKEILDKADIVKVISHYVPLEKKGKNYTCLCPFHDDQHTGNFYVEPQRGIFRCFACNAKGNSISFIKKYEHLSDYEAAKKVADICGFPLPDNNFNKNYVVDEKRLKILKIIEDIYFFYSVSLLKTEEGKVAREYLINRGLDENIINRFNIGYSLKDGKQIIDFLTKKGYSIKEISETGIIELDVNPYDKNKGRVSFAIKNNEGKIVGFSCRTLSKDRSVSKYINTKSTKYFDKSRILYNYFDALNEIQKLQKVYIFEGFMDVIAAYRAGYKNVVCLMGTELTKENLYFLKKLNCQIIISLDLDEPGQKAAINLSSLLEQEKIQYKFVNNDVSFSFKDADEIISNLGEDKLKVYLDNLIDKSTFLLNFCKKKYDLSVYENKVLLLNFFKQIVFNCKEEIEFENIILDLVKITGFSFEAIKSFYLKRGAININNENNKKDTLSKKSKEEPIYKKPSNNTKSATYNIEKLLLKFALNHLETINELEKEISVDEFSDQSFKEIYEVLIKYKNNIQSTNDLITLDDILSFTRKEINNDEEFERLQESIKLLYNLKLYDDYSLHFVKNLIVNFKDKKEQIRKSITRKTLLDGANDNNDRYLLGAMISLKKKQGGSI